MKKIVLPVMLGLSTLQAISQNVGVGTPSPNAAAKLEIYDANRGLLIPRVALTALNNFSPVVGVAANAGSLLVYNTSSNAELTPGFYYWNTSKWVRLQDAAASGWNLNGNAGTDTAVHFIGTTDDVDLKFKIDGEYSGRIQKKGIYLGHLSGSRSIYGQGNAAYGTNTLKYNTSGYDNTAIGVNAMVLNETGSDNTALGDGTLYNNVNGASNTAIGDICLLGNRGSYNTGLGARCLLENNAGHYNTALGYSSLTSNNNGSYNVAAGSEALYATIGDLNTAMGHQSLYTNTNGSSNTAIGRHADVSLGNHVNATAIGAGAIVNATNKIRLGDNNVTVIEGAVAFSHPSDSRFKTHVQQNVPGLSFINQLNPVTYDFDTEKYQDFVTQKMNDSTREKLKSFNKASKPLHQTGFIAQQVEAAANKLGFEFDGLIKPQNNGGHYSLAYSQFVIPLVQAVKEQQAMIEQQHADLGKAKQEIQQLKNMVLELQQKIIKK